MANTKVKKESKNKRISLKKVYAEVNHREFSNITHIKDKFLLKSNFKNFLDEHKIQVIVETIIILGLLIGSFWYSPLNLLYVLLFILVVIGYSIYSSTYSLRFTESDLIIKYRFETERISYDQLFNIYLAKSSRAWFTRFYTLNIIYQKENSERFIRTTLPTYSLNHNELLKFFNNFEIGHEFDKKYNEQEEKKEKAELRRQASDVKAEENKIIIIFFAVLAVIIVGIVIGAFALLKK